MKRKNNNKNAVLNFAVPLLTIAGLSVYSTVYSKWNAGLVAVIIILALIAGFYFWLWRKYF